MWNRNAYNASGLVSSLGGSHVEVARGSRFGVDCFKWSGRVAEYGRGKRPDNFRIQQRHTWKLVKRSWSDSVVIT
jgi:hypothetical protein